MKEKQYILTKGYKKYYFIIPTLFIIAILIILLCYFLLFKKDNGTTNVNKINEFIANFNLDKAKSETAYIDLLDYENLEDISFKQHHLIDLTNENNMKYVYEMDDEVIFSITKNEEINDYTIYPLEEKDRLNTIELIKKEINSTKDMLITDILFYSVFTTTENLNEATASLNNDGSLLTLTYEENKELVFNELGLVTSFKVNGEIDLVANYNK
ncbi:MAG: hypothetical protein IAC58_03980 [Firmicutes bacterium]|uniref:Uncharacterized protein n=1 Tax=Candidatus Onthovivens merdipullorum TaxID=2840889 RepID=A0A9D9DME5_9BACL|nr:hypothetical protein [Candidatus Onthovivens merdipullorum]